MKRKTVLSAVVIAAAMAMGQAAPKVPFTTSKETTAITGPLLADGAPDYVGALNERYGKGVTPENNAFVAWLGIVGTGDAVLSPKSRDQILKLAGAKETPADAVLFKRFSDTSYYKSLSPEAQDKANNDFAGAGDHLWGESTQSELAAYLKDENASLDRIVEVSKMPRWWIPAVSSDGRSGISVLLPSLGMVREAGRALCARATLRAGRGDVKGFIEDAVAAKRLGRLVGRDPTLIGRLVGLAMDAAGNKAIAGVAGTGGLCEADCKALEAALAGIPARQPVLEAVDIGERWMQLDLVAIIATGHGKLLGPVFWGTSEEGLPPVQAPGILESIDGNAMDWNVVFRELNAMTDQMVQALKGPSLKDILAADATTTAQKKEWGAETHIAEELLKKRAGETREAYSRRVLHQLLLAFYPSLGRTELLTRRVTMEEQMLDAVLKAAEVKAKTGSWPKSLGELVTAGLIKEVPKDLCPVEGAGDVKYRVTGKGIRIYSVGENGKDDGGENDGAAGKDDDMVGVR